MCIVSPIATKNLISAGAQSLWLPCACQLLLHYKNTLGYLIVFMMSVSRFYDVSQVFNAVLLKSLIESNISLLTDRYHLQCILKKIFLE